MKNVWRTTNKNKSYLDNNTRYIAVRISNTTIKFFPWPKFTAREIRKMLDSHKLSGQAGQ